MREIVTPIRYARAPGRRTDRGASVNAQRKGLRVSCAVQTPLHDRCSSPATSCSTPEHVESQDRCAKPRGERVVGDEDPGKIQVDAKQDGDAIQVERKGRDSPSTVCSPGNGEKPSSTPRA